MCSEARVDPPRPKIELLRVSSSERAKIPVNPVQLSLVYRHIRSATYARPASTKPLSLPPPHAAPPHPCPHHHLTAPITTTTRRPRWLWAPWRPHHHPHIGPPVSSKSCEELDRVSVSVRVKAPVASRSEGCLVTLLLTPRASASPRSGTKYRVWRGFSRSSRDISLARPAPPRPSVSLGAMDRLLPRLPEHKASTLPYSAASGPRPAARRHRGLLALLRRLSPRLRRSPSPDPPWVKVEPRPPDRTSLASDHSFDAVLHARYPDLAHNNTHIPTQAAGKGGDSGRTSRSGLSGLLTSLRPAKSRQQVTSPRPDSRDARPNGDTRQQLPPPVTPATLIPPLRHISTQVDSRAKGDMTTTVVPLHTSTRPTATAQRPHTLNLPIRITHHHHTHAGAVEWTAAPAKHPSPPPPLLSPIPLSSLPPQMSLYTQTASVDSIGSCSLDVNATGTTSPATMEVLDGSQRSLRSVSLEHNLSQVTSGGVSPTTTPVRPILKPQPYTDPGSGRDGGDGSYKAPSYLGISCAVNGYNRLNRYDSSLRDGFRSRDASPARLAFSRSRDSSPMRPEWKGFDPRTKISPQATAAKIKELKEELAKFKAEFPQPPGERGRQNLSKKLGRRGSQGRSVSVDRGYLTKAGSRETMNGHNGTDEVDSQNGQRVRLVEITMTDASPSKSSSYQFSQQQRVVGGDGDESFSSHTTTHYTSHTNGDTPDKSFIQSRIERLYGPSALGAGFRSRRSLLELEKEQRDRESTGHCGPAHTTDNHYDPDAKAPEGFPSVFRHLRPEFRTQLQVKRSGMSGRLKPDSCLDSLSNLESPKRPGRVIPITIETAVPKKPPVIQPKPGITPNNDLSHRAKPVSRDPKPVLPQKVVNGIQKKTTSNEDQRVNGSVGNGVGKGTVSAGDKVAHSPMRTSSVNGLPESGKISISKDLEEKDGHYFLKVAEGAVRGIEREVERIEADLEALGGEDVSEEVRGNVFAAIGKARLLSSQKIQQFQGLCHKNIAASPSEEFPTTNEDLAGFWDMVSIQVVDVNNSLQEIDALRSNGWKEVPKTDKLGGTEVTTGRARRKPAPRPARPATKSSNKSVEKTEEGKNREKARRKMMEERRKAMKEAMRAKRAEAENADGGDAVEIFIPETK